MKRKISLTLALMLALALMLTACGGKVQERPFALGTLEGNSYKNTYAGFGCDLDESWMFYSAEELQTMPGDVQKAMEGSELEKMMDSMDQIMDMKADNMGTMASVNLLYSKMDPISKKTYQNMSEEKIIDATLQQQDMMIEAYEQAGINDAQIEKVKVTFLGQERWAMKTTAKIQGMDYYVLQVLDYHAGSYGLTLSCATLLEDNTEELLDLFYSLNE